MFFVFKKFLSLFLFPLPLLCIMLLAATIFLLCKKGRRRYAWLTGIPLFFAYWAGSSLLSGWLIQPLQDAYPHWQPGGKTKIEWIYVLGGGEGFDCNSHGLAYSSRLGSVELVRMAEGVRIKKLAPHAKYYTTVFSEKHTELFKEAINKNFGIAPGELNGVFGPRDTKEEIRAMKKIVGDTPGVVVSSAIHLPRVKLECSYAGLNATVSSGPRIYYSSVFHPYDLVPSSSNMSTNQRAIKEYMGIIWGSIRSRLFD